MTQPALTDAHPLDPSDDFLTNEEAAALLRISPRTLAIWRCTGRNNIPFIKLHRRRVVYRRADLLAWVEQRRAAGTFTA